MKGYGRKTLILCPVCGQTALRYDSRRWQHLNAMQRKTFIVADVPGVNCPQCVVKQIEMAWAEDWSRFTKLFEAFAIQVLKAVRSKARAPRLTALSWDPVDRIAARAVHRGRGRRFLEGLSYTWLDEKCFEREHDYVSVLRDIVGKRVFDVAPERTREAADMLWVTIPEARRQGIAACAMDMQETYLEATRAVGPQTVTVHDKFHCAKELNKAVDLVRRQEHRGLKAQGQQTLTRTKYVWLENPRSWTQCRRGSFQSLRIETLKVGRAWSIKKAFAEFWNYHYAGPEKKFFDRWYFWANHSRLELIITAAKALKRHFPGLLAYTKHRITNAAAEGTNGRIQLFKASARGYRNFAQYRISMLFHCGILDLCPNGCVP